MSRNFTNYFIIYLSILSTSIITHVTYFIPKKSSQTNPIVSKIASKTQLIWTLAQNHTNMFEKHISYRKTTHIAITHNCQSKRHFGKSTKSYYSIDNNCVGDITPAKITHTPKTHKNKLYSKAWRMFTTVYVKYVCSRILNI